MIINRSVNHWLVLFMLVMSPAALAVGDKMNSVYVILTLFIRYVD